MSKLLLKGNASGTGTITLETPNTNTDQTITLPNTTGALITSGGSGATLTDLNASSITSGTLSVDRIADSSITSGKLASGAAASNLGNYVSTVNGSTGAVTVQPTLVSGTTIKTVNSTSLLGSGDVAVQATLVSGTNIKTINGTTLLGSGDITVGASTSFNAVGTYVWGYVVSSGSGQINSGGTVSAGTGYWQLRSINFGQDGPVTPGYGNNQNNLSGTWANMSAYMTAAGQNFWWVGLFVRVS